MLRTLIEQSKAKKKPLYCCFVDFKKAFDTVPRESVVAGVGWSQGKGMLLAMPIGDVCQGYRMH
jgi:hypothetical protein